VLKYELHLISDTKKLFFSSPQCLTGYGAYPAFEPMFVEDKVAEAWSWITLHLAPRLRILNYMSTSISAAWLAICFIFTGLFVNLFLYLMSVSSL